MGAAYRLSSYHQLPQRKMVTMDHTDFAAALTNYGIPSSELHITTRDTTTRIHHLPTHTTAEHPDQLEALHQLHRTLKLAS